MRILMVNNRLKVYGGEGTYMTSVGEELIRQGHDVQYFGLEDPDHIYGNKYGIYAKSSKNPLKLVKNNYNRKQFAKILDEFNPDLIHLNLIYFTLTPSILVEAKKRGIRVIQTIHDGKMVCPCYQLYVHNENKPCTLCVDGDFRNCVRHKCHKNSKLYSYIAYYEAKYNRKHKYYDLIDKFIFPSYFMRNLHVKFGLPKEKTEVLCNFSRIEKRTILADKSEKYVLYFGRITKIKGVELIAEAAKKLPNVNFKIVGSGDMISLFESMNNVEVLGFKTGSELEDIIAKATISIVPSIWLENCPMSIQESIALGTPVLGANVGGIPELIDNGKNGEIFESNNSTALIDTIKKWYFNGEKLQNAYQFCLTYSKLDDSNEYVTKLLDVIEDE